MEIVAQWQDPRSLENPASSTRELKKDDRTRADKNTIPHQCHEGKAGINENGLSRCQGVSSEHGISVVCFLAA